MIFNLEVKYLDKKGRVRDYKNGGIYKNESELEKAKTRFLQSTEKNISFEVFTITDPLRKMVTKELYNVGGPYVSYYSTISREKEYSNN